MREKTRKGRKIGVLLGLALMLGSVLSATNGASAYTHTGCSWGSYGSTVTWDRNLPAGDYRNTAGSAAYSWANATDINGMDPTGGSMYGFLDNKGNNGYNGWATWSCNGSATGWAYVTLNPYYMDTKTYTEKKTVWVHEFGHGLGLNHSGSGAVMYNCSLCTGFSLPQTDDINGINALY